MLTLHGAKGAGEYGKVTKGAGVLPGGWKPTLERVKASPKVSESTVVVLIGVRLAQVESWWAEREWGRWDRMGEGLIYQAAAEEE